MQHSAQRRTERQFVFDRKYGVAREHEGEPEAGRDLGQLFGMLRAYRDSATRAWGDQELTRYGDQWSGLSREKRQDRGGVSAQQLLDKGAVGDSVSR